MDDLPPGPLVTVEWLAAHLDDPRVRVLDTRGRVPAPGTRPVSMRPNYEAGHIPGASYVEWTGDFIDHEQAIPNQLARADQFTAAAAAHGIGFDSLVIVYDDAHSIFAGRLWWAFRAMGHDAVRVLDGGWSAWLAEQRATSDVEPALPAPDHPFVASPRPELRREIDQVRDLPPDVVLIDARSRERFAGAGGDPIGGHIPGAVNVPYSELVRDDGRLRSAAELRAAFARANINVDAPPGRIVTTCGSGISASIPLLALDALRSGDPHGPGRTGAIYDGSWAEWSRSGLPIVRDAD